MKYYSFSQLQLYRRCPAKYKKAYIDKIKDLPNEAMKRGSRIHSEIADYVSGNTIDCKFDKPYNFDRFVSNLTGSITEVEEKITIDFFEFGLIGYVDYSSISNGVLNIVDWKSGYKDGDVEQLKIYAGSLLEQFPEINVMVGYFYYVDQKGRYDKYVFTRQEIEEYMQRLEEELTAIYNAIEYPETPNDYCKWCSSYAGCMKSKKFAVERIETKQDFIKLLDLQKLAEATIKKSKELIKEYMEHNCIDTFVNGTDKIYLTTTTTMRIGKMKKEELIDVILQVNPGEEKTDLSKLKATELVKMLSGEKEIDNKIDIEEFSNNVSKLKAPEPPKIEEKKEIDTNISNKVESIEMGETNKNLVIKPKISRIVVTSKEEYREVLRKRFAKYKEFKNSSAIRLFEEEITDGKTVNNCDIKELENLIERFCGIGSIKEMVEFREPDPEPKAEHDYKNDKRKSPLKQEMFDLLTKLGKSYQLLDIFLKKPWGNAQKPEKLKLYDFLLKEIAMKGNIENE